ncbi:Kynurenine formamidase [Armadillidium nasatum]|uniref:Kynurenine formamidase n=1 Tax=Armadillidium nasatum TaxID=96803 RepID=A0A5N5T3Z4_9CRUS|nr:Kynurenine formamidase [Armadillidium nasatum]
MKSGWKLSPLHHVEELAKNFPSLKVLIVAGENDSPEFKRQSKQYCQALAGKEIDAIYEEEKEVDHFNLVENLCDENYHVTIRIIKFIKRTFLLLFITFSHEYVLRFQNNFKK